MSVYVAEDYTSDEEDVLRRYFTNLHGPVFALVNLPEVVKGALFARYSRSPKSLRRLFLDEFLDQIGAATRTAYGWQENYQWPQNGAGSEPTIGFEYAERPANIAAHSVMFSIHKQSHRLENFKLHLCCVRARDWIIAELHYDAAHFEADDVKRLGAQFAVLVRSALANPRTTIDELEILDEAERRRLLFEWNQTNTDGDIECLVHELFEEQVEQKPDCVAVICGNRQLTYAELNEWSNRLAHRLRRSGVKTGAPVGLYLSFGKLSVSFLRYIGFFGLFSACPSSLNALSARMPE